MLHDNKMRSIIEESHLTAGGVDELAKIVDWAIRLLRRQYLVVLFVAGLGLAVGIFYLSIATPVYTAETTVYVDLHRSPISRSEGVFGNDPIEIDSQIQIVKSKGVASAVVKKLQLTSDPELAPHSGFLARLFGAVAKPLSEADRLEQVIPAFEKNLIVDSAASRVISIKYDSRNPERAAEIANAVANAYINDQLDAKFEANRIATSWLQDRQDELRKQAEAAQRAAEAFKVQHKLVTAGGKSIDDRQTSELSSRLIAARAQASDALARLNRLQAIVRNGPSDPNLDGAISEVSNPIVMGLRQQYLDLSRREADWADRYGKDHLAVVNLRNRMQELRKSMFDELRLAADAAKNNYEAAKQAEVQIQKQLNDDIAKSQETTQLQVTLQGLEATAAGYRSIYDTFVQRYMGSTTQAPLPITEARVISPAYPPLKPSKPRTLLVFLICIAGGLGLGCGLAVLRDLLDHVFRTAKQVEAALHVPCVALVPLVKNAEKAQVPSDASLGDNGDKTTGAGEMPGTHDSSVFWTVIDSPLSSFAESVRSVKLAVDLQIGSEGSKVVGLTSTLPNEGKSTLAAALGLLIAQVGGRVVVVDCDLRNPNLTRALAPEASFGVVDVVSGKKSLEDALVKEPLTNLSILPTGKKIAKFLTSETLGGEPLKKIFEKLREKYDYVIVDFPPLTPIVDVRATGHLVDGYLLTVEWGRTNIVAVEHALESAPKIYESLVGTVLNKTDMDYITRYDSSGRYGYNKHFARYGYIDS